MLKHLFKVTPYLIGSLLIAALMSVTEAVMMIEMTKLVDIVMGGQIELFEGSAIKLMSFVLCLLPLCIMHSFTYGLYKKKANLCMKSYYIKGVFSKNISEFHKDNNSKYLSGLTNDFNQIEVNLIEAFYEVCMGLFGFAAGIWMIAQVTPIGIVLVGGMVIFNVIFSQFTSKPVAKHMGERSDLFDDYTSYIKEVIFAFHIIKSNNLQERIRENFRKRSEKVQQKGYIIDKILSYIQAIQNAGMGGTMTLLLLGCAYLAITGNMTMGGALLVIQGGQMMMWPMMNVSEKLPKLFTVKGLVKKMEETLLNEENYEETLGFTQLDESITLNNVSFGYDEELILKQVNLELKKGGKYLIIGPSGGGKSTLLKLLRKYFNPKSGEVKLDDKVLKDIKKEDFFSHVANVEQQVFIFEDTLRNNLTMYKDYSDEEILEAVHKAGLDTFLKNLPEGLDTMIYDNGSNVSGGERSRIVIARGLLAKASIIFMDEAFAALDMERARAIEESILALEGVTVINVSHVVFKETREKYDGVLVVKHGGVEVA